MVLLTAFALEEMKEMEDELQKAKDESAGVLRLCDNQCSPQAEILVNKIGIMAPLK